MAAGIFTGLSTVGRREAKAWNWEVPLTQIKPAPVVWRHPSSPPFWLCLRTQNVKC